MHPRRLPILFLLLAVVPAPFAAQAQHLYIPKNLEGPGAPKDLNLPDIGNSAQATLSPEQEQLLGEAFMRSLRRALPLVTDPLIEDYIQSLGMRLASSSDDRQRQYTFFVVDSGDINAFAGPGGYIGVNSGLILATESESDLAAVVAHEIAHVTQGHIARSVELSDQMSIPTIAALLASVVIATQNPQAGQAALLGTLAGSAQTQVNSIRRNEKEADRVGIRTLARAKFDPHSMPGFFEKLQSESRYNISAAPEFLRTHPVTQSRIADSMNRAEQYPYHQYEDSLEFHIIRALLRIRDINDPQRSLEFFATALKRGQYINEDATRYGYVLALIQSRQFDKARQQLLRLMNKQPDYVPYLLAQGHLEWQAGNTRKSLAVLQDALQTYPRNYPLTVAYARGLLEVNQSKKALAVLRDYADQSPPAPTIYQLIAHAEEKLGRSIEAHEALAEYDYLMGDTQGAIHQLETAQRAPKLDFYQTARIDARLAELKELAKEEKEL